MTDVLELETPHGLARAHVFGGPAPVGTLVLGHGAGGSVEAPDLVAVRDLAVSLGCACVLVEQPYRVARRRSAAPAKQLDAAWESVVSQLPPPLRDVPLICGGRSSGARVACRTAGAVEAVAVLCLAFPLHPPRRNPDAELKTRLPELDGAGVPVLVVQGSSDRFGVPASDPAVDRVVVEVRGDHGLKSDKAALVAAVADWLPRFLSPA